MHTDLPQLDVYGRLLATALFPAFERVRSRPTVTLLEDLHRTERSPIAELHDLQLGLLRRLARHAVRHTEHYREVFAERGLSPSDLRSLADLAKLPLLDRETVVSTLERCTAHADPRWVIEKATSGTTCQPVVVRYNAESRHWRDATRWRGYAWAGYRIGMRAFHYWGVGPAKSSWFARQTVRFDDRSVVMRVVPNDRELPESTVRRTHEFANKYLPGVPFAIEYVDDIPLTPAGKHRVVSIER